MIEKGDAICDVCNKKIVGLGNLFGVGVEKSNKIRICNDCFKTREVIAYGGD